MNIADVRHAKNWLSRFLTRIVACEPPRERRPDILKGKIVVPEDFVEPLPEEELERWEGA